MKRKARRPNRTAGIGKSDRERTVRFPAEIERKPAGGDKDG